MALQDIVTPQRMNWGSNVKDEDIYFKGAPVSWNFLKFMGIDIIEGRDFTKDDEKRNGVFIFNEEAKRQFDLKLNEQVYGHQGLAPIVGFCKNYHFMPLQYGLEPFAFYVFGNQPITYPSHAYIRIAAGTNYREAMDYVRKAVLEFDPSLDEDMIQVKMFDEELGAYYESEERLAKLITIFTPVSYTHLDVYKRQHCICRQPDPNHSLNRHRFNPRSHHQSLSGLLHHLISTGLSYQREFPVLCIGSAFTQNPDRHPICHLDRVDHCSSVYQPATQLHDELRHGIQ